MKILIFIILFYTTYVFSTDLTSTILSTTDNITSISFEASKRINNIISNEQGAPGIALDKNSNLYITWSDMKNDASDSDIFFSKSTNNGLTFSNRVIVNDTTTGLQIGSKIAVDKYDNICIVWYDKRSGDDDIYFSISSDGGKTFSKNVRVNDIIAGAQTQPEITLDSAGNIYVVWQSTSGIYFSKSTNNGTTFSASKRIDDSSTGLQMFPTIALDTNRNIYVSWIDTRNGANVYDVYFSISSDGGTTFKSNIKVAQVCSNMTTAPNSNPHYLIVGKNKNRTSNIVYIAYESRLSGAADADIYLTKSTDNGLTFSSNVRINDETTNDQSCPKIDINGRGDLYAIWQDKRNDTDYDVYFAMSTNNGDTFGTSIRVNDTTTNDQGNFSITGFNNFLSNLAILVDWEGNIYSLWNDKRNGTDFDLYFTKSIISYKKSNLDNVISYPNPMLYYNTIGNRTITFIGLTDDATLRIYNIVGELVRELTNSVSGGKCEWDVRNKDNEVVASGVYFYVITDSAGNKKTGKVAIIK